jgi:hypothetical protein
MRHRTTTKEKELTDRSHLLREWDKWHAEELTEALEGVHGAVVREVMCVLDQLELESAGALLDAVRRQDWRAVSPDVRLTILHQVNEQITRLRDRHDMPPIDDPLPGAPESVFCRIKALVMK